MKKISIHKAHQLIDSSPEIEGCIITIAIRLPEFASLKDAEKQYQEDAEKLVTALFNVLPQGTMDRVIIEIFKQKASLYRGLTKD